MAGNAERLEDLKDMATATRDGVTGLGDHTKGPLVQGRVFGEGHVAAMSGLASRNFATRSPRRVRAWRMPRSASTAR